MTNHFAHVGSAQQSSSVAQPPVTFCLSRMFRITTPRAFSSSSAVCAAEVIPNAPLSAPKTFSRSCAHFGFVGVGVSGVGAAGAGQPRNLSLLYTSFSKQPAPLDRREFAADNERRTQGGVP